MAIFLPIDNHNIEIYSYDRLRSNPSYLLSIFYFQQVL